MPTEPDALFAWNVEKERLATIFEPPNRIESLAFSADGSRLLFSSRDGSVTLGDFKDGRLSNLRHPATVSGFCTELAWLPGHKSLLATSTDPLLPVSEWDADTGERLWVAARIELGLTHVVVLDADHFATIGDDMLLRLWERRLR